MYDKKLQLMTADSVPAEASITKEERYELIALIAQRFEEFKEPPHLEERQIWDSSDIDVDFEDIVSLYN